MGQPSGPGLLSFLNHLSTPSISPFVTEQFRSSSCSCSTYLLKDLVIRISSGRSQWRGARYRLEKCWVQDTNPWWSVSSQILLQFLWPFACCWKNFVFSSPAYSQIALLLSLQSASFWRRSFVLVASSEMRCSLVIIDLNPSWSDSLSWEISSSILFSSSHSILLLAPTHLMVKPFIRFRLSFMTLAGSMSGRRSQCCHSCTYQIVIIRI